MDCPQGQDDKQDTTQDRTGQDRTARGDTAQSDTARSDTAQEKTAPNDTAGDDTGREDTGREDTGQEDTRQDESANPFAALSSAEKPAYELNVIDEDLGDLEESTGEMARRLRKGDSEGLAPLRRMAHLAVRGLRQDLQDVREHIRNRFG